MSHHEEAEAAVRTMSGLGVRAIRLLYTDLHGVARGKDIPIGHFGEMCEEGVAFCSAVMGTDLRHTPVVGGEEGYVDFAIKPSLNTLRSVPWQPEVAWCLGEAWTLDGSAHWPSCPRALLQRVVDAYGERGLSPVVAPELEFFLAERDADAKNGLRRYVDELSRVYTVGAVSDPREIVLKMLLWCDDLGLEAFAANHEFMNSQYEINIKHSRRPRGRRPSVHAQGGGEGDRRARGPPRDLYGPPIRRPGRLGLPRPPLGRGRERPERVRRRGRAGGAEPARGPVHRGRDRARAGPAGAARPDRERLQADPPRQPRPDARELGPRQPHGVLPCPERARLAGAGGDPHRRRLGLPASDHRGRAARRPRRDRARPDAARPRRRRRLPPRRGARRFRAPVRPRRRAGRARGRHRPHREARPRARRHLPRDEALRGGALRRGGRRARRRR